MLFDIIFNIYLFNKKCSFAKISRFLMFFICLTPLCTTSGNTSEQEGILQVR